jgi:hypothetical protein
MALRDIRALSLRTVEESTAASEGGGSNISERCYLVAELADGRLASIAYHAIGDQRWTRGILAAIAEAASGSA